MARTVRAGTKVTYRRGNIQESVVDVCFIYPDSVNKGDYVALSLETGKVGVGPNVNGAYIDLVVGLAFALSYKCEFEPQSTLGVKVTGELREKAKAARRLPEKNQGGLLRRAQKLINDKKRTFELDRKKLLDDTRVVEVSVVEPERQKALLDDT